MKTIMQWSLPSTGHYVQFNAHLMIWARPNSSQATSLTAIAWSSPLLGRYQNHWFQFWLVKTELETSFKLDLVQEPKPNLNWVLEVEFLEITFLGKKGLKPGVNWLTVRVRTKLSRSEYDFQNQNLNFFSRSRPEADPGFLFVVEPQLDPKVLHKSQEPPGIYLPHTSQNQAWTQCQDQAGMKVLNRTQDQVQAGVKTLERTLHRDRPGMKTLKRTQCQD